MSSILTITLRSSKYISLTGNVVDRSAVESFMNESIDDSTLGLHCTEVIYGDLGQGLKSHFANDGKSLILYRIDVLNMNFSEI